jgi:RNA polymerase sigma factor (sigma-70 family)
MTGSRVSRLVDHLFRHESGRLIASLTRILGVHNLDIAEEIVQETLLKALQTWPYGPPVDNPPAWLMRVARNKAIDRIRAEKHRREFSERYKTELASEWTLSRTVSESFRQDAIEDDQLRLIFTCCDPVLSPTTQIALTLRLICGLGAAEIASAFLSSEETIRKRLTRGKQKLRDTGASFEVLDAKSLLARLDAVLKVLYLLFNEGYNSPHGEVPIRRDLCLEALRLALLVSRHPVTGQPKVDALVSLICLHSARIPARLGAGNSVNLLADQDRSLWNQDLIDQGVRYLTTAGTDGETSIYHFEAAIAACHARATRFETTDWHGILQLYDLLLSYQPSPIVRLNRAIALGYASGPAAAIASLESLRSEPELAGYHLLPAALGEFYQRQGDLDSARACIQEAIALARGEGDRKLLEKRLIHLDSSNSD